MLALRGRADAARLRRAFFSALLDAGTLSENLMDQTHQKKSCRFSVWLCHPMLPDDIGAEIDDVLVVKTEKHTLCHGLASLMGFHVAGCRALRLSEGLSINLSRTEGPS